MGTRGLFALLYKGYYYTKYNHYDSYPEGLGQDLVSAIPASKEQFDQWLKAQRKHCDSMASSKNYGEYKKSKTSPANDIFIEWTYTYDLDNLLFIVDSKVLFSLRGIAQKPEDEWIQFIATDARGHRCLSLDAPPELVGRFEIAKQPFLGGDPIPTVDDTTSSSIIHSSSWSNPLTPHHRRLLLAQVNVTIAESYSVVSMFPKFDPSGIHVQDFAMTFLEAIVPNNQAIVVDHRSPTLTTPESNTPNRSPWNWYRGCLVLIATKLDDDDRFRVYVQAVATRAKAKNLERCTALLWSVRHVAVVEISAGSVSHSDPIPLLAAYGSDEEGFMSALHLLWHYLPYPRSRLVDERPSDSTNLENLPTEIVIKIMSLTDHLHYPKFQFLSRSFFKLWWKQLRIGSYTLLPDVEQVGETCRRFRAFSPDDNIPVELRLKVYWGKQTGNIWRSDEKSDRIDGVAPNSISWTPETESHNVDDSTQYRIQHFCSYWPEEILPAPDQHSLPRVADRFSGRTNVLICEVVPI